MAMIQLESKFTAEDLFSDHYNTLNIRRSPNINIGVRPLEGCVWLRGKKDGRRKITHFNG
jgi:hypothetical protein